MIDESLNLLIVDDQKLFSENLKIMIELKIPGAKVVGIASNGYEALEMYQKLNPNLILLDIRMPKMDGVEFIRQLHTMNTSTRIIVLTTFDDDQYVFEALKYGAAGYLLKQIEPDDLAKAILEVHNGGTLISPQVTKKLIREVIRYRITDSEIPDDAIQKLTPRELDVLKQIGLGKDNREIAQNLQLAEGTVRNHVSNIYEKLNLKDRGQAIRYAILHGLNENNDN
ncbi:MAG: response regulator [Bacteroidota bacterium]